MSGSGSGLCQEIVVVDIEFGERAVLERVFEEWTFLKVKGWGSSARSDVLFNAQHLHLH